MVPRRSLNCRNPLARYFFLLSAFIALVFTLIWPEQAWADDPSAGFADKIIVGTSYVLARDKAIDGNFIIINGQVRLESGSLVTGNVVQFGGELVCAGHVDENIVAIGGLIQVDAAAYVRGNIVALGSLLKRSPQSQIGGVVITDNNFRPANFLSNRLTSLIKVDPAIVLEVLWFLFKVLLWTTLGLLAGLFFLEPLERVSRAAWKQPAVSWGVGTLTVIVLPVLLTLFIVTIVLIPMTLLGFLILGMAFVFGWVAVGFGLGNKLNLLCNQKWSQTVATGVGTLLLSLVCFGIAQIIPYLGWILIAVIFLVGLGAVLLTRFGTQSFPVENR